MNENRGLDPEFEVMPWDKIDNLVFDIGNVLIRYAPALFVQILFPLDEQTQENMLDRVYNGPFWPEFDRGTMGYEAAAAELCRMFGGEYEQYMEALCGWVNLTRPIEEGWRAVRRCRQKGKRLFLLSNFPAWAYESIRARYASRFEAFEGGTISCYVHQLKPERQIFETLLGSFKLVPERTLFLDDTQANVEAARKAGMHAFHVCAPGSMDRFFAHPAKDA